MMRTLLIVDDELLIADGLCELLARSFSGRLNVLCRYSAAAALQVAQEQPVDILLTDINMPNVSGLELHRSMQALHPSCLVIYLTGYSDFEYARTALDQHAYAYILKGEGDDVVISIVEQALSQLSGPEPEIGSDSETEDDGKDRIRFLQDYIRNHLNEDLSLNRLAEFSHLHPVYLSRVFKEITGITVGDFINRTRLEKVESLLKTSRLTVLEISRKLGFATDNYFCRWFRKQTGMSPHQYREKNR
jgi:two-component system sensor histidine kinase YesM